MNEQEHTVLDVDAFLQAYPEEQLQREIETLEAELEGKREELKLVQRWKALRSLEVDAPSSTESNGQDRRESSATPATRREAIERVMAERPNKTWKLEEIRQALVERGWLADDEPSGHRLQVTTSRMTKRGQLRRPRKGYYRLPPEFVR